MILSHLVFCEIRMNVKIVLNVQKELPETFKGNVFPTTEYIQEFILPDENILNLFCLSKDFGRTNL